MKIAVLGLGNPVVGDDRVGLAVAREVTRCLAAAPLPGVEVLESSRGGLELLDLLSGFDRAILVDCIARDPACPGRIHWFGVRDICQTARFPGAHELGVGEVICLAERLGIPMPERVEIVGIEGVSTAVLSEEMSPEVENAVAVAAREILARLEQIAERGTG